MQRSFLWDDLNNTTDKSSYMDVSLYLKKDKTLLFYVQGCILTSLFKVIFESKNNVRTSDLFVPRKRTLSYTELPTSFMAWTLQLQQKKEQPKLRGLQE